MKIEEKALLLSGKDVWHTNEIKSENIKSIMMADGPHGLRKQVDSSDNLGINSSYKATLFPAAATVACSFNKDLAWKMGEAIGKEARSNDVQVVLGPGVNIKRNPLCGRNFEYYSEDPYLAGKMGEAWISGIQSQNVGASLKHFACNNQETYRFTSDSIVDERALREIYLKPFELAIKANPATVMCSYNKINGTYGSENKTLLTNILRNEWKYSGLVISDWGAVSNRVKGLISGLDLEMPSTYGYNTNKIIKAFKEEKITVEDIDKSVKRVNDLVDKYKNNKLIDFNIENNHKIAQEIASESIVLLKNDNNILPLNSNEKVAIVGQFAKKPRCQGGGSSFINSYKVESVFEEIDKYTKNYQYFDGYSLAGDGFSEELINEVVSEIIKFDKVIVMTGLSESYEAEGFDRTNIDLPAGHLKLINAIVKENTNVIITLYTGSQVAMPFINDVKAILNCHLLGAASGIPLLDILYGKLSPSGRLATTYPIKIEDDPTTKNFANGNNAVWYQESIYVGYRYYQTFNKDVLFPFGHGLSYTSFEYSNLEVSNNIIDKQNKIMVKVNIKNNGNFAAKEVVQLYVENNMSSVYKPLRELRRFEKIFLEPNEEKQVSFELEYNDFSYYDIKMKNFHVNKGIYKIQVCKCVNKVVLEKQIYKQNNDEAYEDHLISYYNKDLSLVTKGDFESIYGSILPPKNIIKKRPYTMDATIEDLQRTLIGKIMKKIVLKEALKLDLHLNNDWMKKVIEKTISETPIRTLATMSGGIVSMKRMEGILDLINFRFIRGIRKI